MRSETTNNITLYIRHFIKLLIKIWPDYLHLQEKNWSSGLWKFTCHYVYVFTFFNVFQNPKTWLFTFFFICCIVFSNNASQPIDRKRTTNLDLLTTKLILLLLLLSSVVAYFSEDYSTLGRSSTKRDYRGEIYKQNGRPSCHPTNNVKALKETVDEACTCWLKYGRGLSNLILTLTGQKLTEWSLKPYMSLPYFYVFTCLKIQKRDFLRFFCFVAYVLLTYIYIYIAFQYTGKRPQRHWRVLGRVYFKRGVQPKCGVQNEKCGVQDWKMWSPK